MSEEKIVYPERIHVRTTEEAWTWGHWFRAWILQVGDATEGVPDIEGTEVDVEYVRADWYDEWFGAGIEVLNRARTMARFLVGWWPALEDDLPWGDDAAMESHPAIVAARALLKREGETLKETFDTHDDYLGDGVYASFDGYHIVLDLRGQDSFTRIALEPPVFDALVAYRERLYAKLAQAPTADP